MYKTPSTLIFVFILIFISIAQSADDNDFEDVTTHDIGFKVSFINVGQGNASVVLDNTTGKRIFIDAGSSQHPIHPQTKLKGVAWSKLREQMEFFPDALPIQPILFVCSHPDKDHLNLFSNFINLAKDFLNKNPHVSFYLGGSFEKYLCSSDSLNFFNSIFLLNNPKIFSLSHALTVPEMVGLHSLAERLREDLGTADGHEGIMEAVTREIKLNIQEKIRPFILRSSISSFSEAGGRIITEILCANAGHSSKRNYALSGCFELDDAPNGEEEVINFDDNVNSIIMRLTFYNSYHILLTGDATGITTDRLRKNFFVDGTQNNFLDCMVSLACHHGAITEESNNMEWVFATQPQYVIFSAGKYEKYHHPQFDTFVNYSKSSRMIKNCTEHSILCARNTDGRNRVREISADKHDLITRIKKLQDSEFWHELKTRYGLFSTHSSGTIVIYVEVSGIIKPIEFVW